jgi:hypothetical protein
MQVSPSRLERQLVALRRRRLKFQEAAAIHFSEVVAIPIQVSG